MKDIIKDFVKYIPALIVPAILGLISVPIITNLFPPADYGNYSLVQVTVSIFSAITSSWIAASITRFYPKYQVNNQLGELYNTATKLTLYSIFSVVLIFQIIIFLIKKSISTQLYFLMQIGCALFIVTAIFTIIISFLRAQRRVTSYSILTSWQKVTGLVIGLLLILKFNFGIEGMLLGSFFSLLLILLILWKKTVIRPSIMRGSVTSNTASRMVKYGLPVIAINIVSWVMGLSDRYIIGFFRGSTEVGIYSASYAISESTIFLFTTSFMLAAGPIGYHIWEGSRKEESRRFLHDTCRYYILFALPATVGLSILAKPIVNILVGPEYFQGYVIVPFVAFGVFLVGITHRFSESLNFCERTDIIMYCMVGSAIVNFALNIIYVPIYGYVAAAVTTLIAYGMDLISRTIFSRIFFRWPFPFKSLGIAIIGSTIMALAVYAIGSTLSLRPLTFILFSICLGVIVYIVVLIGLKEVSKEEIQTLKSIIPLRRKN